MPRLALPPEAVREIGQVASSMGAGSSRARSSFWKPVDGAGARRRRRRRNPLGRRKPDRVGDAIGLTTCALLVDRRRREQEEERRAADEPDGCRELRLPAPLAMFSARLRTPEAHRRGGRPDAGEGATKRRRPDEPDEGDRDGRRGPQPGAPGIGARTRPAASADASRADSPRARKRAVRRRRSGPRRSRRPAKPSRR